MKTCKKEHLHADILRAIADGEEIQWCTSTGGWRQVSTDQILKDIAGHDYPMTRYRIKPKTVSINGYEVPTPLTTIPSNGEVVYFPDMCKEYLYNSFEWAGAHTHLKLFYRGLLHKNFEAAIAHAKALMSFTEDLT